MRRTLTRLTAASVAILTLTAGTVAAVAVVNHGVNDARSSSTTTTTTTKAPARKAAEPGTSATAKKAAKAAPAARSSAARAGAWKPRPEQYSKTVTIPELAIPMDDGTILRGDLILPADASGKAINKKFPVIATITAYNKGVQQYAGGLAGGDPTYLVKRGYAQLT